MPCSHPILCFLFRGNQRYLFSYHYISERINYLLAGRIFLSSSPFSYARSSLAIRIGTPDLSSYAALLYTATMTNTLKIDKKDNGVVLIQFNRPHALNALNMDSMIAFWKAIRDLQHDADLQVLILGGAGEKAFCSGGDLVELREKVTEDDARYFTRIMTDALYTMECLPVPVIAAINGYALGGGSEIALACDMRLIDSAAKMGMVQINMALTPGWGAGQRLLRIVGYSKAMEMLLKGEALKADELIALKIANQKVEQGKALERALDFANQIAERPANVVRGIKQLLRAGLTMPYDDARQAEYDIFPDLWADEAHIQAVESFFERQAAKKQENS